jgi:predicted dehydrogenase
MSDLTLRWGVISTANIGRVAVNPAIQAASNGELLAVASRDSERARSFAEAHSIPRHYGSYQDLLVDADIDAVYNPLPNSLHLEWTVRAADAGKHILCEKPMALNERECREMIGELRAIRSAFTFRLTRPDNIRMDPELGGGALMDVGCYCVNVSRTLAGAEPDEVQATARWAASGVDEQLVGTLMFSDGVMAHFDCALTMERCESYEVAGTDGYLTVPESFLPGTNDARILEHRGRGEVVHHTIAGADEYQRMVEHFGDAVLHGRPLRYTPEEAAQNMRVIEALYRSARGRGRVVAIRD